LAIWRFFLQKVRRGIQSFEVGAQLLLALASHGRPMVPGDLAKAAHLPAGKAHPYLVSFGKLKLVIQHASTGQHFASLFTENGVYHDLFYGAFEGRERIATMITDWFYKSASDFRWDMHDPVSDGRILYARYTFSYRSLLPEAKGARAMFEGVSIMRLEEGLIADYREVANAATGFVDMNFAPERIAKILAREGRELKARPEMERHLP
jgi:SnoaL-like domain/IclR helix-turn-helix domain